MLKSALDIYSNKIVDIVAYYVREFEKSYEFSERLTGKFRQDLKLETEVFLENVVGDEFMYFEMKQFQTKDKESYYNKSMDLHELVAENLIMWPHTEPNAPETVELDSNFLAKLRKEFTASLMTNLADFRNFRVSKRLANTYWRAVFYIFMEHARKKKPDLYLELNLYQTTLDRRDVSFFGLVYNDKHNPSDWDDC